MIKPKVIPIASQALGTRPFHPIDIRAEAARITLGERGFLSGPIDLDAALPTPDQIRAQIENLEQNGAVPTEEDWRIFLKPCSGLLKP
jgi:hypothetical protein